MPKGYKQCGICKGTGKVTEGWDYEFMLRDPITSRCLNCDGSGLVPSRSGVNRKALAKAKAAAAVEKVEKVEKVRADHADCGADLADKRVERSQSADGDVCGSKRKRGRGPFGGLVEVQAAGKPETDLELAGGRLNSNTVGLADGRLNSNGDSTIEVTITCRLTYEQLAQVMKYNEVSHKGDM